MSEAVKRRSRPGMAHVIYDMQKCLYTYIHTHIHNILKYVGVNGFWIFCNRFVVVLTYVVIAALAALFTLHACMRLFVCLVYLHFLRLFIELPPSKFHATYANKWLETSQSIMYYTQTTNDGDLENFLFLFLLQALTLAHTHIRTHACMWSEPWPPFATLHPRAHF